MHISLCLLAVIGLLNSTHQPSPVAKLNFQASLPFGKHVKPNTWFPVTIEIINDDKSFKGETRIRTTDGRIYYRSVECPSGSQKRFQVFCQVIRGDPLYVELVDAHNHVKVSVDLKIELFSKLDSLHLVLGGKHLGLPPRIFIFQGVQVSSAQQATLTYIALEDMPELFQGLEGVDSIFVDPQQATRLNFRQKIALTNYVKAGGKLIINGGGQAVWLKKSFLSKLIPGQIINTANLSSMLNLRHRYPAANPSESYGTKPYEVTVIQPDGEVFIEESDVPLLTKSNFGLGEVYFLAFDISQEPFFEWEEKNDFLRDLFRTKPLYIERNRVTGLPTDIEQFRSLLFSLDPQPAPEVKPLLVIIVVYLLATGPIEIALRKKYVKNNRMWYYYPACVIFFTILTFTWAYSAKGNETLAFNWNILSAFDSGNSALELSLIGIYPQGALIDTLKVKGETDLLWHLNLESQLPFSNWQRRWQSSYKVENHLNKATFPDLKITKHLMPIIQGQQFIGDLGIEARIASHNDNTVLSINNSGNLAFRDIVLVTGSILNRFDITSLSGTMEWQLSANAVEMIRHFSNHKGKLDTCPWLDPWRVATVMTKLPRKPGVHYLENLARLLIKEDSSQLYILALVDGLETQMILGDEQQKVTTMNLLVMVPDYELL